MFSDEPTADAPQMKFEPLVPDVPIGVAEADLAPPILLTAGAEGDPHLKPHRRRVSPGFPRQGPQFRESRER